MQLLQSLRQLGLIPCMFRTAALCVLASKKPCSNSCQLLEMICMCMNVRMCVQAPRPIAKPQGPLVPHLSKGNKPPIAPLAKQGPTTKGQQNEDPATALLQQGTQIKRRYSYPRAGAVVAALFCHGPLRVTWPSCVAWHILYGACFFAMSGISYTVAALFTLCCQYAEECCGARSWVKD